MRTVAITLKYNLQNKLDELPIFNLYRSWFFPNKLRKGCTSPLLTKYTGDSWVMELLRHTKWICPTVTGRRACTACGILGDSRQTVESLSETT